ncbi:MAG: serine/threonine protein kinase, partial [Planctomycetes bacterium]|nr:serine/threonine protein kinase [Planctomycetota bacterium]
AAGLIHRDIKPANLFITSSGGAKLADLGLARATDAHEHTSMGVAIGTPAFMPPEQASGDIALDVRTDIYSLGATLYALLTGRAPYLAPTLWAVIAKVLSAEEPADPRELGARVSERTCALLRRMMAKDREQRPANIAEVITEIESLLAVMPAWSRTTMVLPVDVPRSGGDETIVGMDLRG